jgi:hypothetical protein
MKITIAACAAAIFTLSSLSAHAAGSTAHASASFSAGGLEHASGYAVTSTSTMRQTYGNYGCYCSRSAALSASGASATTYGAPVNAHGYAAGVAEVGYGSTNVNTYSSSSVGILGQASSTNAVSASAQGFDGAYAAGSASSSASSP